LTAFTTPGSPRDVARAIEDYARAAGRVSALVVPWESDSNTLSLAVTSVKADGWAIEHTDLGTIRVTDRGGNSASVAIIARDSDAASQPSLKAVFERFSNDLQRHLTKQSRPVDQLGQP
jgi:hypothetical protein